MLVAISGGPDSTALAHALVELSRRAGHGWRLVAGHLHHGLRGADADADRDFAAGLAARLDLPLVEGRVDVGARREEEGGSIEAVAREERYRFLELAARGEGLAKVATGHHRDDQVETVLQRILRGTGIRGLAGMPRRRRIGGAGGPEVVRPLLGLGREDVRAYLAAIGETAREDLSNLDEAHFRNRLRREALPYLRALAPGVDAALLRLSDAARQAAEVLEGEAQRRLDAAGISPSLPVRLPLALVRETPPELRAVLLTRAVERVLGAQLLRVHAEALLALATARPSGSSASLPRGIVARREYDDLVIERPSPEPAAAPPAGEVKVRVPGRTVAPGLGVAVEARVVGPPFEPLPGARAARFDLATLPGPLALRRPRPGDAIYPTGMRGRKKLQDLFVDLKVPRAERARAVVLDAGGQVAWVLGRRADRRFVTGDATRQALELKMEEL